MLLRPSATQTFLLLMAVLPSCTRDQAIKPQLQSFEIIFAANDSSLSLDARQTLHHVAEQYRARLPECPAVLPKVVVNDALGDDGEGVAMLRLRLRRAVEIRTALANDSVPLSDINVTTNQSGATNEVGVGPYPAREPWPCRLDIFLNARWMK